MARKNSYETVCSSNISILLILVLILVIVYFIFNHSHSKENTEVANHTHMPFNFFRPNYGYTNLPNDVLLDPYSAPLRDNRYMVPTHDLRGMPMPTHMPGVGVPINVPTRALDAEYRQVGILTRTSGTGETILPLMGRPLYTARDKWQFYTMNDKNNQIKLPMNRNGRSCTNENGCDNLYSGDVVDVEGFNDQFKVTSYDNAVMRYIPFV
jgi:hypothetical protein